MPRPPTAVGTYGTIRVNGEPGHYVARAWFRDLDGKARQVERSGPTKTKARDTLKLALRDRARTATGINGDTRIREIAPEWLAGIDAAVNAGERSPSTAEQYRRQLDVVVLPGVGELRVREATVPLLDKLHPDRAGPPRHGGGQARALGALGSARGRGAPRRGPDQPGPRPLAHPHRPAQGHPVAEPR